MIPLEFAAALLSVTVDKLEGLGLRIYHLDPETPRVKLSDIQAKISGS